MFLSSLPAHTILRNHGEIQKRDTNSAAPHRLKITPQKRILVHGVSIASRPARHNAHHASSCSVNASLRGQISTKGRQSHSAAEPLQRRAGSNQKIYHPLRLRHGGTEKRRGGAYFERIGHRGTPVTDSLETLISCDGQAPCLCVSSVAGGKNLRS